MQPDPKVVEELARRIVEVAHPLRIVLFGSAARGEMEPDSDIDVLVIVSEGAHRRHTAQSIYRRMIGFPMAVDVVVVTESDLSKYANNFTLGYYPASRGGEKSMPPALPEVGTPADWLRYARSDLALACVQRPAEVLLNTLCFHAQQAIEKSIKAVLLWKGIRFPLKAPPCHLVYAFPLPLLTSEKIGEVFPTRPFIMPMVHVRHRDGKEDRHALNMMAKVIKRRVSPDLFASGVIKRLALASGGHIRDFLSLVREAAGEAEAGARITQAHAKRAIAGLTDLYNRTIQQDFIEPLDYVVQHNELSGGSHDGELVNRLLVLEYRNGDTWTALHPCVKEAPRYVRAPRARKEETNL